MGAEEPYQINVFSGKVQPDLKTMLELVREFDDRGRIFHALVEVDVPGSITPPEPSDP